MAFYINYEECKFLYLAGVKEQSKSFILTMRNVNAYQEFVNDEGYCVLY